MRLGLLCMRVVIFNMVVFVFRRRKEGEERRVLGKSKDIGSVVVNLMVFFGIFPAKGKGIIVNLA